MTVISFISDLLKGIWALILFGIVIGIIGAVALTVIGILV